MCQTETFPRVFFSSFFTIFNHWKCKQIQVLFQVPTSRIVGLKILIDEKLIEIFWNVMLFRDQLLHDGIFNGVAHSFGLRFFSRSLLFFSDSKFFRNVFQAVVKLASYTISITLFTLIQSWSHETSQNGSWHHMKVLNLTLLTTTIITTTSRQ